MAAPVTIYGINGEVLSSIPKIADGQQGPGLPIRQGSRGEQFAYNLWNGMQALAMEGSYWVATSATPGTGIVLSVATGTSFADTQALICLNNNDTVGTQGKIIYLDFIKLIVTTVPTSATSMHLAHRIDQATRGTAGTQLGAVGVAPKPSNMNIAGTAAGACFALGASAVSTGASANVRNMGRNVWRSQIPVIQDDITIKFGSAEMAAGGVSIGATAASGITVFAPPVAIGPGQSYVCNEWAVARTAALSGEIIVGWIER